MNQVINIGGNKKTEEMAEKLLEKRFVCTNEKARERERERGGGGEGEAGGGKIDRQRERPRHSHSQRQVIRV